MRILIYSNAPWCGSGYGTQSALIAKRLKAEGHEVALAAFYGLQGVPLTWEGLTVYPGSSEDQFAQDIMLGHYQHFKADIMISLMDQWVLDGPRMKAMIDAGMRLFPYVPVDCEPLSFLDQRNLDAMGVRPIAMSRHGEKMLAQYKPWYVPHAVDTELFHPLPPSEIAATREKGGFTGRFLIGINAANQDPVRKGFAEQMAAFRLLANRHDDVRLLIHTRMSTRQGVSFERIMACLQLDGLVQFGNQYLTAAGLTSNQEIARWYAMLDVLTNCSYGEGFGLPVLEAQACGTPVIVTDCSAMRELAGPGWSVAGEYYWNSGHSSWWTRPSIGAIYEAYEEAYEDAANRREASREFALGYDIAAVIRDYWTPVLREIHAITQAVVADADPAEIVPYLWEGTGGLLAFEVGANHGQSIPMMQSRFVRVVAFEPSELAYRAACEIPGAEVRNVALSDHSGEVQLALLDGQIRSSGHHAWEPRQGDLTPLTVPCITLDEAAAAEGMPDFVNMDIEGSEADALRGASSLLEAGVSWLIEFHSQDSYDQCLAILKDAGYSPETVRHPHYPRGSDLWYHHGWIKAAREGDA